MDVQGRYDPYYAQGHIDWMLVGMNILNAAKTTDDPDERAQLEAAAEQLA